MASLYWYGGTGNWSDYTNHWSNNSGNSPASPAAAAPTSTDDVFIDASSGFGAGGTITLDANGSCNDITCTSGHTLTITKVFLQRLDIYGSIVFESGLTINVKVYMMSTSSETITMGSATYNSSIFGITGSGTYTLQDHFVTTNMLDFESGTFDANDYNVTAKDFYFYADADQLPVVVMGSGVWEVTGTSFAWYIEEYDGEAVVFTPETSTIKFTNVAASGKDFYGGGKTYYNIWFLGSASTWVNIYGSNTFNDFRIDAPNTVQFLTDSAQAVSSFTATGTNGNIIDITTISGTGTFTLSKTSGTVECDYLDIARSTATGGATWRAFNSTDSGNNTGWLWSAQTTPAVINGGTFTLPDPTITEGIGVLVTPDTISLSFTIPTQNVLTTKYSSNYSPTIINSTNHSQTSIISTNYTPLTNTGTDWTQQ